MGSCECGEGGGVLEIEPTWLWPRRRRAVAAAGAVELGAVAVVLKSENGKGEEEEELMGSRLKQTASSGRGRSKRGGDGDLGGRRLKKTAGTVIRGCRRRLDRCRRSRATRRSS